MYAGMIIGSANKYLGVSLKKYVYGTVKKGVNIIKNSPRIKWITPISIVFLGQKNIL